MTAPINQLNHDCLQLVLALLDTCTIGLLCKNGNSMLTSSIRRKLQNFCLVEPYSRDYNVTLANMKWPCMLNGPLPSLSSFTISTPGLEWNGASFTCLPKTLLQLSLKATRFCGDFLADKPIFDLPNLLVLKIENVDFVCRQPLVHHNGVIESFVWLPLLLLQAQRLESFVFVEELTSPPDYTTVAAALPGSLQMLSAPRSLLDCIKTWPPNLQSIVWNSDPSLRYSPIYYSALPGSLTSADVGCRMDVRSMYEILLLLPLTLLELGIKMQGNNISDKLLKHVARFSCLQSLVIDSSGVNFNSALQEKVDLSLLPRSLTRLSDNFAKYCDQWVNLSRNVSFVWSGETRLGVNARPDFGEPLYNPGIQMCQDHAQYFPTNIMRIAISNEPPPRPLVGVKYASCYFNERILARSQCATMFASFASAALTTLRLEVYSASSFCWIDDATSLPNLTKLSMSCPSFAPTATEILDWLKHVPQQVESLHFKVNHQRFEPYNGAFGFPQDSFSPNLKSLSLQITDCTVRFPRSLPSGLTSLAIDCREFKPAVVDADIDELPRSLNLLQLSCRHNLQRASVNVSQDKIDSFCGTGIYTPKRQLPIRYNKVIKIDQ